MRGWRRSLKLKKNPTHQELNSAQDNFQEKAEQEAAEQKTEQTRTKASEAEEGSVLRLLLVYLFGIVPPNEEKQFRKKNCSQRGVGGRESEREEKREMCASKKCAVRDDTNLSLTICWFSADSGCGD